jgi:anti-sigma28 factor (negative regulator of flagellin synthesis)
MESCRTQAHEAIPSAMKREHRMDQDTSGEVQARNEWFALLDRLQEARPVDERLDRLREAIACGEFQVDARVIAERLIARLLVP